MLLLWLTWGYQGSISNSWENKNHSIFWETCQCGTGRWERVDQRTLRWNQEYIWATYGVYTWCLTELHPSSKKEDSITVYWQYKADAWSK